MPLALPCNVFAGVIATLLGLIAHHGHQRRVPAPIVVMAWQLARGVCTQVTALLGRVAAGTARRHPARRPPKAAVGPRARPAARPAFGWLVTLIPETAQAAGLLHRVLHEPGVAELIESAPQLRRGLRPLCRMLGVRPPRPITPPEPPAPRPTAAPLRSAARPARSPIPPRPGTPGPLADQTATDQPCLRLAGE